MSPLSKIVYMVNKTLAVTAMQEDYDNRLSAIETLITIIKSREHIPKKRFRIDERTHVYIKNDTHTQQRLEKFKKRLYESKKSNWVAIKCAR